MSVDFVNILTKINQKNCAVKKVSVRTGFGGRRRALFFYVRSLIIPIAAAIRPTGMRRKKPPTSTRHTMNIGTAKTRSIVATIFANPHVILKVRLIALISKTIAKIEMIISVILISPFSVFFVFRYLRVRHRTDFLIFFPTV